MGNRYHFRTNWGLVARIALLFLVPNISCLGSGGAEGYVRTVQSGDGWWFGQAASRFISLGVNYVSHSEYWPSTPVANQRRTLGYYDVRNRFKHPYKDWAAETETRLVGWGFNTIGAWSSDVLNQGSMYFTAMLAVPRGVAGNCLVDVFAPEFAAQVDERVRGTCSQQRFSAKLIGYFIGNELPWYGEFAWPSNGRTLAALYDTLPASSPGKIEFIAFLQHHFKDWSDFHDNFSTAATSWSEALDFTDIEAMTVVAKNIQMEWAGAVAERFYRVFAQKIRSYDANHLILGSRFAANVPFDVWIAASRYCDVLSVNYYTETDDTARARWDSVYAATGKPILISETSWRATDNRSNNPNTVGAKCTVSTQGARAAKFEKFAREWLNQPYIVGIHWFEYFDEPPGGRYSGSGENSNYGLVDIHDVAYSELTRAFTKIAVEFENARPAPSQYPQKVDLSKFGVRP